MDSPSYFWFVDAHQLSNGQNFDPCSGQSVFADHSASNTGYLSNTNSPFRDKAGYFPLDIADGRSPPSQNVEDLFLIDLFRDSCNGNTTSGTSSDHNTIDGNTPAVNATGSSLWEIDDLLQSFTHSDSDSQVPNFPIGDFLDTNDSSASIPACEASLDEEIRNLLPETCSTGLPIPPQQQQCSPSFIDPWETMAVTNELCSEPIKVKSGFCDSDFAFMASETIAKPRERQRCTATVKDKGIAKPSSSSTIRSKKTLATKASTDGWTCPICGTVLLRDFTRHLRTHDEMARFQCPFPKDRCAHATGQFNRQYDMKKHLLHDHFKLDRPEARAFTSLDEKLKEFGVCQCGFVSDAREYLDRHVLAGVCTTMCPFLGSNPRPWALKQPIKPPPLMSAARQSLEQFRARKRYQNK